MKDFTPIPNEWFERLADGSLTVPMYTILTYLMRTCKWSNGVWRGTAERIVYDTHSAWSKRQINRYLTRLHECGYLTRKNVPGARGGYKILLNNYGIPNDPDDSTLRPTKIKDWREDIEDDDSVDDTETTLTMSLRCPCDDPEMSRIPDVPDVPNNLNVPDDPNVLTHSLTNLGDFSDQEKSTTLGASSEEENQTVKEVSALVNALTPNAGGERFKEQRDWARKIVKDFGKTEVILALIEWNHLHENDEFFYRCAKQLHASMGTGHAMDNYDNHVFETCLKCKTVGMRHYRTQEEMRVNTEDSHLAQRMMTRAATASKTRETR